MSTLTPDQRRRLNELGEKMKTARGKALDAITAEVDSIIGHENPRDRDPEAEAEFQARWKAGK